MFDNELYKKYSISSGMITRKEVKLILVYLSKITNVCGDIVELGCNIGSTSVFIKTFVDLYLPEKKFYVYDSFEGLPKKSIFDINENSFYKENKLKVTEESFISYFKECNVNLPIINKGWFKDCEYPEKVSFAFFDGDFYNSIIDSFNLIYHKLSKNAILLIHDYNKSILPGVKQACNDFLEDKLEKVVSTFIGSLGYLIKL